MGIGVWLGLGRSEGAESIRISRFIRLEKPGLSDDPNGSIFPRFLIALEHLENDFEREIERDRRSPFPR
jgi:hypothetical protein